MGTESIGIRTEIGSAIINSCEINNANSAAIYCVGGTVYVNGISGINNVIGIQSGINGSVSTSLVIAGNQITISADTKYQKLRGSAIIANGVLV